MWAEPIHLCNEWRYWWNPFVFVPTLNANISCYNAVQRIARQHTLYYYNNGKTECSKDLECIIEIPSATRHYCDIIMGAAASQITSRTIVYSTVYSDADQRKHQSSASLAFVRGIQRGQVNSPHKGPVTRKMFPFDDVIMVPLWICQYGWRKFKNTSTIYCSRNRGKLRPFMGFGSYISFLLSKSRIEQRPLTPITIIVRYALVAAEQSRHIINGFRHFLFLCEIHYILLHIAKKVTHGYLN